MDMCVPIIPLVFEETFRTEDKLIAKIPGRGMTSSNCYDFRDSLGGCYRCTSFPLLFQLGSAKSNNTSKGVVAFSCFMTESAILTPETVHAVFGLLDLLESCDTGQIGILHLNISRFFVVITGNVGRMDRPRHRVNRNY